MRVFIPQISQDRYIWEDELEADQLGVCFMNETGYDPQEMISVMQILEASSQGNEPPEFFSTHPGPDRRIERLPVKT